MGNVLHVAVQSQDNTVLSSPHPAFKKIDKKIQLLVCAYCSFLFLFYSSVRSPVHTYT